MLVLLCLTGRLKPNVWSLSKSWTQCASIYQMKVRSRKDVDPCLQSARAINNRCRSWEISNCMQCKTVCKFLKDVAERAIFAFLCVCVFSVVKKGLKKRQCYTLGSEKDMKKYKLAGVITKFYILVMCPAPSPPVCFGTWWTQHTMSDGAHLTSCISLL